MNEEQYRNEFKEDTRILKLLSDMGYQPDSIWDVGASNGAWAILCAEIFPDARYDLFEPLAYVNPAYALQWSAEHSRAKNFLSLPNRHLHAYALGSQSGSVNMAAYPNGVSSTLLPIEYTEAYEIRHVEVEVLTGHDAVQNQNLPVPGLLKMDVQGYEMDLLLGAESLLDRIDVVLAECWLIRSYEYLTPLLSELTQLLSSHGFEVFDLGTEYRPQEGPHAGRLVAVDVCFIKQAHPLFRSEFRNRRIPNSGEQA